MSRNRKGAQSIQHGRVIPFPSTNVVAVEASPRSKRGRRGKPPDNLVAFPERELDLSTYVRRLPPLGGDELMVHLRARVGSIAFNPYVTKSAILRMIRALEEVAHDVVANWEEENC
jgi:hypothetical protein